MAKQAFTVDLNKPLVCQVGHLGQDYDAWVHDHPIVTKQTPRFFQCSLLEFFTLTPWWAIPSIWLPVVWWFVSSSLSAGLSPYHALLTTAAGVYVWTFMEYSIHRFIFHVKTTSYWGNTFHYLIHGCHHKHPMDGLRLVFPPAGAAVVLTGLWNLIIKVVVPKPYAPAVAGGILLGYVMYDCTHYYLHHGKPVKGVSHDLKRSHMNHHFKVQDKGFGITSTFWDRVFGTLPPKSNKKDH